jgi:hypothetical protein
MVLPELEIEANLDKLYKKKTSVLKFKTEHRGL